jgi:hypothetical protein
MKLITPVAFIVFNRPQTTAKVFAAIRQAQPSQLLIIADGARLDRVGEAEKCQQVRDICDRIDWQCEVKRNYANSNLGCQKRIISGLNWVFTEVEEAIILEDDCLPHPTFFEFCQELLEKYRGDRRIMSISGDNYLFGKNRAEYSYYFSIYSDTWGWATWRRAWKYNDINMKLFPEVQAGQWLEDILGKNHWVERHWHKIFEDCYTGRFPTAWDYQWVFACLIQNGLSINPNVNLISNIGFDENATHTRSQTRLSNMKTAALTFPLVHPPFVIADRKSDALNQSYLYKQSFITKIKNRIESKVLKLLNI